MKLWPKALKRRMRFHELRHSTATLLLRAGEPPQHVQSILRHADIRTTISTYGHLGVDALRETLASLPDVPLVGPGAVSSRQLAAVGGGGAGPHVPLCPRAWR